METEAMDNNQDPCAGRDNRGRFVKGAWPGGPGRPRRETEREYLDALIGACPPDRWQRIVERAITDAEQGDAKARDFLAGYLVGKARQPVTPNEGRNGNTKAIAIWATHNGFGSMKSLRNWPRRNLSVAQDTLTLVSEEMEVDQVATQCRSQCR